MGLKKGVLTKLKKKNGEATAAYTAAGQALHRARRKLTQLEQAYESASAAQEQAIRALNGGAARWGQLSDGKITPTPAESDHIQQKILPSMQKAMLLGSELEEFRSAKDGYAGALNAFNAARDKCAQITQFIDTYSQSKDAQKALGSDSYRQWKTAMKAQAKLF